MSHRLESVISFDHGLYFSFVANQVALENRHVSHQNPEMAPSHKGVPVSVIRQDLAQGTNVLRLTTGAVDLTAEAVS